MSDDDKKEVTVSAPTTYAQGFGCFLILLGIAAIIVACRWSFSH